MGKTLIFKIMHTQSLAPANTPGPIRQKDLKFSGSSSFKLENLKLIMVKPDLTELEISSSGSSFQVFRALVGHSTSDWVY